MKTIFPILSLIFSAPTQSFADVESTKKEILELAQSYQGQGDSDRSKQKNLEILVEQLLEENPQPPLQQRLTLIYGAWKQVWGPYDYRNDDRGVDPKIDPKNIVQVVFEGGYYYNVNPTLNKKGNPESTTLLRGEFTLDPNRENTLNAQFTNLRKIKGLPQNGLRLQDLPALSENNRLEGEKTVLPGFIVRTLFGGGYLEEVYTDEDLRITFGSGKNNQVSNYIYILSRLPN